MFTSPLCVGARGAYPRTPCTNTQNQCGRVADACAGALTCPQGDEGKTQSQRHAYMLWQAH
ncbi:hypothetical protein KDAU_60800 [Dictyobacter aurantiacus]|uniref:Uncharacterized protein n=1 Tax=Dictyobacter aurantiacus TaxID=1936993 RepID=A0A401ZPG2_9CHLR|nr:hypothetical protein KDAU_60800 [Dictyobacter aurantiacus]